MQNVTSEKERPRRQHGLRYALLSAEQKPETYRLPRGGGVDPFWGFTRTFYYNGERLGYWTLIRVREPGKRRGVVLIPYDEVAEFVRKQREAA
jgi:hypothetical protein